MWFFYRSPREFIHETIVFTFLAKAESNIANKPTTMFKHRNPFHQFSSNRLRHELKSAPNLKHKRYLQSAIQDAFREHASFNISNRPKNMEDLLTTIKDHLLEPTIYGNFVSHMENFETLFAAREVMDHLVQKATFLEWFTAIAEGMVAEHRVRAETTRGSRFYAAFSQRLRGIWKRLTRRGRVRNLFPLSGCGGILIH